MTSRRGFLRGILAGAPLAATVGVGVVMGSERSRSFNFTCSCGEGVVAEVPEQEGQHVEVACKCGTNYDLEWCGDHFKTRTKQ